MRFNNQAPKTRKELEENFKSNDVNTITESLVALVLYEEDWRWAQNICLEFLQNTDPDISGLAAICLGHIARIHHEIDKEKVFFALKMKFDNPLIKRQIEDALEDIMIFCNQYTSGR